LEKVTLDQQQPGLETDLIIDRGTAARLGLTVNQIDNNLYDAFGQSQVSTIYAAQNQYHVVMEVAPEFSQNPETLNQIYVGTSGGPVSGVQATRPLVGTVLAKMPAQRSKGGAVATTTRITSNTTRSLANNALANTGHGATSTGAAVGISPRPWSALRLCPFRHGGQHAAPGHSPKFVCRRDNLVHSRPRRLAQPGGGNGRGSDTPASHASLDSRQL
jgi:multidrug efflux pump